MIDPNHTVTVRTARAGDAPGVAAIYAPVVRDTVISFEVDPPDGGEMARRIAVGAAFVPWRVARDGDRVVGFAYAAPFRARPAYRWTCETTAYVAADVRRRGIARALYGSLLADLRARGFRTVVAVVTLPNPPSVGLHEALGFRRVGVFPRVGYKTGRFHDAGWWSLDLAPDLEDVGDVPAPRTGGGTS